MSAENLQNVDYTVFEVLGAYKRYVITPENIDNLIQKNLKKDKKQIEKRR